MVRHLQAPHSQYSLVLVADVHSDMVILSVFLFATEDPAVLEESVFGFLAPHCEIVEDSKIDDGCMDSVSGIVFLRGLVTNDSPDS